MNKFETIIDLMREIERDNEGEVDMGDIAQAISERVYAYYAAEPLTSAEHPAPAIDFTSSYPAAETVRELKTIKNTLYGVMKENEKLRRENARLRKLYARYRRK